MALPQYRELTHGTRAKTDLRGAGLRGIARDVEHCLDELLAIAEERRNARVVIALDVAAEFGDYQAPHPLEHFMDAHRLDARGPMRREHAVHEALQAICLLDDDLRVFAQFRLIQLALQKLGGAAQAAKR